MQMMMKLNALPPNRHSKPFMDTYAFYWF